MAWSRGLGVKFIAIVVVILSATLGGGQFWLLHSQQQLLEEQLIERGRVLGHFIALISPEAILSYDFVRLNEYAREVTQQRDVVYGLIVDSRSRPITSWINRDDPLIQPLLADDQAFPQLGSLVRDLDSDNRVVALEFPILHDQALLGHLLVGLSRAALIKQAEQKWLYQSALYLLVILFLSLAIYLTFRWNVLHPIRRLIQGAGQVSRGQFVQLNAPSRDEMGQLTRAFNRMVQDIRADRIKLQHQANYDVLTGLPNRMLATERLAYKLSQARREGGRLAVLFVDLDDFKVVNDTLGHATGDDLLVTLGERFKSRLREVDTIARLGGDEFLVLLPNPGDNRSIEQVALRLAETVSLPLELAGREMSIHCSVGIAIFPDDAESAETLMAHADNAMYQAKNQPRNSICFFTQEMNQRMQTRLQLEQDLNQALPRNELKLNFQPLVDARTGAHCGAEVLLRWHHPERGWISPVEFIPVAESTGLIVPIGDWVLRQAAAYWVDLVRSGLQPGYLAVNVSRVQFGQQFAQRVAEVIADYRLPPGALELELTESVLLDDQDSIRRELAALRLLGIRLALDDFGTGYSALSYLKKFRFDHLKIDRSFISGLPEDEESASLVRAIIAMAHGLDLRVVAEGVETEGQMAFIARQRCDFAQGYLLARPMDGSGYRSYLQQLLSGQVLGGRS